MPTVLKLEAVFPIIKLESIKLSLPSCPFNSTPSASPLSSCNLPDDVPLCTSFLKIHILSELAESYIRIMSL